MEKKVVKHTFSVCPKCLERIPAMLVSRGEDIYMEKECPLHGKFSSVVWRGEISLEEWCGGLNDLKEANIKNCPKDCGLCENHRRNTCCILLEVTRRCNLDCSYCFAYERDNEDPKAEDVKKWLLELAGAGRTFVQFSGGEPTMRDDLPELVQYAKACGHEYIQLNSNGIRLAEDEAYVKRLAQAGLSFVFLQFDGTKDSIYQITRGRDLLKIKRKAIENCGKFGIGVTLVPVVIPGVNEDNLGEMLDLAVSLSPVVRGIHFQPVSYFGRYPKQPTDEERITLPEIILGLEKQTNGVVNRKNLKPSKCDHAMCGFHGSFVVMPTGLKALSQRAETSDKCCCRTDAAVINRAYIGKRWRGRKAVVLKKNLDMSDMSDFVEQVRDFSFTITAMAFQDCYTLDLDRLQNCSLHVYNQGRIVPFCARYMTIEV